MAIIYSYPNAEPQLSDTLLGVRYEEEMGNAAKNFNVQDLINLTVENLPAGPAGPQGPQGIQGPQGSQGEQGIQGIEGPQGIQGETGAALTVLGSYPDLTAFLAGAGGSPGLPGTAWIIESDGSLYVWNTATTAWEDVGDLQGPQGVQGEQGPQGIQGEVGPQGPQGIQGIQGPSGGFYAQTALGPIVTFASGEASIIGTGVGSLTVPANGFQVGDSFIAKMCGPITCANNQNIRIRIKTNGIVLIDTGTFTLPQITNKIFDLSIDFTITKIGAAGVAEIFANGMFSYNKDANFAIEGVNTNNINNTTFNTTILNTFEVDVQWLSSNVANSIRTQNFTLTKVY